MRALHHGLSVALLPTAVLMTALMLAPGLARARRHARSVLIAGFGLIAVTAVAQLTGHLLPWTSQALRSVRANSDVYGYRTAFSSAVRYVLVGTARVNRSTLWRWFLLHTVLLPVLVVASATLLVRGLRRPDDHSTVGSATNAERY